MSSSQLNKRPRADLPESVNSANRHTLSARDSGHKFLHGRVVRCPDQQGQAILLCLRESVDVPLQSYQKLCFKAMSIEAVYRELEIRDSVIKSLC